ncbi:MAG: hypothetical protein ACI4OR_04035 [Alphaproteobacteria bacterium]
MKKTVGDVFNNPENLYMALQGTPTEFLEDNSLDFYDQVYPRLLKSILDLRVDDSWCTFHFYRGVERHSYEDTFILVLGTLIFFLFEPALKKCNFTTRNLPVHYDIEKVEKMDGIYGALAKYYKKLSSNALRNDLMRLLRFFRDYPSKKIKLRPAIPAEWADEMTKFLHDFFHKWGDTFQDRELMHCIDEYEFIPSKEAIKELPAMPQNVRLLQSQPNQFYLVVQNLKFNDGPSADFIFSAMYSQISQILVEGVIFDHCCTQNIIALCHAGIETRAYFKNCTFQARFAMVDVRLFRTIRFENCKFLKGFLLEDCSFDIALFFENCLFKENQDFKIERCRFKKFYPGHLSIKNCTFYGHFSLKGTNIESDLEIRDSAFFSDYDFSNVEFNSEKVNIANLLFNTSKDFEQSRRNLVKCLRKHKCIKTINSLGLAVQLKELENEKFDYDAYQIAYNSGFLKPEYAAYFLGKSKVYLAKKRTEDKKKLVRDSLPFKIDGRDIQYPVEALLAFKAKDWDTLKNLRKKYPIPTD